MSLPEIGEIYRRKQGDRSHVKVVKITEDEYVVIRDYNGRHFVKLSTFNRYFERVKDDKKPLKDGQEG
ncbi:hypothetical protein [Nitratifractor sp.]